MYVKSLLLTETYSVRHQRGNYIDSVNEYVHFSLFTGTTALTGKPAVRFGLFDSGDRSSHCKYSNSIGGTHTEGNRTKQLLT